MRSLHHQYNIRLLLEMSDRVCVMMAQPLHQNGLVGAITSPPTGQPFGNSLFEADMMIYLLDWLAEYIIPYFCN